MYIMHFIFVFYLYLFTPSFLGVIKACYQSQEPVVYI